MLMLRCLCLVLLSIEAVRVIRVCCMYTISIRYSGAEVDISNVFCVEYTLNYITDYTIGDMADSK